MFCRNYQIYGCIILIVILFLRYSGADTWRLYEAEAPWFTVLAFLGLATEAATPLTASFLFHKPLSITLSLLSSCSAVTSSSLAELCYIFFFLLLGVSSNTRGQFLAMWFWTPQVKHTNDFTGYALDLKLWRSNICRSITNSCISVLMLSFSWSTSTFPLSTIWSNEVTQKSHFFLLVCKVVLAANDC